MIKNPSILANMNDCCFTNYNVSLLYLYCLMDKTY